MKSQRAEQQRAKDTKAAIIKAARAEFAAFGFEGASMRRISAKAGVNYGLLPHHFGDKEGLWKATAIATCLEIKLRLEQVEASHQDCDADTIYNAMFRELVRLFAEIPEFYINTVHANQSNQERLEWLVEAGLTSGSPYDPIEPMRRYGPKHSTRGKKRIDRLHAWFAFTGAVASVFIRAPEFEMISGESPLSEEFVESHIELMTSLFREVLL